jgi:hypothetical protein
MERSSEIDHAPIALQSIRSMKDLIRTPVVSLAHAPDGWNTLLPPGAAGYNQRKLTEIDRREWAPIIDRLRLGPVKASDETTGGNDA